MRTKISSACNNCLLWYHIPQKMIVKNYEGDEQEIMYNGCVAVVLEKMGITEHPEDHCSCLRKNNCQVIE